MTANDLTTRELLDDLSTAETTHGSNMSYSTFTPLDSKLQKQSTETTPQLTDSLSLGILYAGDIANTTVHRESLTPASNNLKHIVLSIQNRTDLTTLSPLVTETSIPDKEYYNVILIYCVAGIPLLLVICSLFYLFFTCIKSMRSKRQFEPGKDYVPVELDGISPNESLESSV